MFEVFNRPIDSTPVVAMVVGRVRVVALSNKIHASAINAATVGVEHFANTVVIGHLIIGGQGGVNDSRDCRLCCSTIAVQPAGWSRAQ